MSIEMSVDLKRKQEIEHTLRVLEKEKKTAYNEHTATIKIANEKLDKVLETNKPHTEKLEKELKILLQEIGKTCTHKNSRSYSSNIGYFIICQDCGDISED